MPDSGFNTKLVKDLAKILADSNLSEIEVETEEARIRVARTLMAAPAQMVSVAAPAALATPATAAPAAAPVAAAAAAPAADLARHPGAVTSPMVGTCYLSPEPGAAPFVKEGATVKEGQQLFIIEAMKTMNPIPAPRSGTVTRILVSDTQPVEFGEPMCIIE
jgi:acetyl-CoA carboxylase biotin carboxyl carrier protein